MLIAIGKERNKESFAALFDYFAPRVKSFLMKAGISEAQADELAQETMLAVWQRAESYDPAKARASTWIYTVARNKRVDALRKVKYVEVDQDDPLYVVEDDRALADETLAKSEEEEALDNLINSLPEEQAFLIRKSFYEDKPHAAIAAETGIALGTIKSRIRLALEKLRGDEKVKKLWP
ncbi:MAG: sigma-70 family RNA polymerase sigma factor [Alphaproteobacteria bacterium]|nr:sigma-70 family RNA polymerase sigma factor [Alphaproteobacteria bacterium]